MIKKLILVIFIFLLCGCSDTAKIEMDYYVDEDTCVVYLARFRYGVSPMYNANGSLKLDSKCKKNKNIDNSYDVNKDNEVNSKDLLDLKNYLLNN